MATDPRPTKPVPSRGRRRSLWAAGAATALFLAWLWLPLAHAGLRRAGWLGGGLPREAPPQQPSAGGKPLSDRLREYGEYFERTSPIRRGLIPLYMGFKIHALGSSSIDAVIIGRDKWLFVGRESAKVDERSYFLGLRLLREEELSEWCRVLSERRRWLEERGIAYRLVIAPNKSTIYPEQMPAAYPRGRRTRHDQLSQRLRSRAPGFPLVDLRPALRAGKKEGLLYWPTDSHWNDLGRAIAYREIVRSLAACFPSLRAIPANAFAIVPGPRSRDLEELLLLPWDPPGPFLHMVPKHPLPAFMAGTAPGGPGVRYRSRAATLPLAIVIHDSFGDTLKPLIGSHFRRSLWILDRGHAFPAARIAKLRPVVVIEEVSERYLEEEPWGNPPELRAGREGASELEGEKDLF